VGTRLTDFPTGSHSIFQHPDVRFASINVAGHDAYKLGAVPVLADAREALEALTAAGRAAGLAPDPGYVEECRAAGAAWRDRLDREVYPAPEDGPLSQAAMLGVVNRTARPGDTIVAAAGSPPGDLLGLWDCTGGRNAHIEFGYSCMGYEIPASLGVRLAQPDGEVYTFIGDGTYLMNPTELATAVQERLKITVLISKNDGFQCIRDLQLRSAGVDFGNEFRARDRASNRLSGGFVEIDYAANAASFGVRTWSVDTAPGLEAALAEAREERGPCAIVVTTDRYRRAPGSEVWWDVAPAEVSLDDATMRVREEYERGRVQQRYYG
jgi:3D-(3,5/4)-trihydroxycyclohexane-1,2-dione acylhydrolase (decyclizing)